MELCLLLRPKQWTKNLIVYTGLLFSLRLVDPDAALRATIAFVAFCFLSSAGYVLNDVIDLEADRRHPLKRHRPLASGRLSVRLAFLAGAALLVLGIGLGLSLGLGFVLVAAGYLTLTTVYSSWLKHLVLLDLFAIAGGFVLRVVGGATAVGVPVSPWLYVCTVLVALFLGLGKRRQELALLEATAVSHRRNLSEYTLDLVDQLTTIVLAAAIMAYSLYTFSAPHLPHRDAMMVTIPLVMYGLFRYLYLVRVKGLGGSPEDLLLTDRPLIATVIAWTTSSTVLLYLVR